MSQSLLFKPIKLRNLELKNRIVVSPMCTYSAKEGVANVYHQTHLGSFAIGGSAVVMVEATGIEMRGRISTGCLAIETTEQINALATVAKTIKTLGSIPAIQLAHAGRKASYSTGAKHSHSNYLSPKEGGWLTCAPSAVSFDERSGKPEELSLDDIHSLVEAFKLAALNAKTCGFEIVEIHSAHGYLLHQFLSPLANFRKDEFGGSLENRMRFPLMVAKAVRDTFPQEFPVFVRISATDWHENGWNIEESIIYAKELKKLGIDLVDVSTGGVVPNVKIPVGPLYQVEFSKDIHQKADIPTGAVGLITTPQEAEQILKENDATLIFMGRELLRNPHWPMYAAQKLGEDIEFPGQYYRAF